MRPVQGAATTCVPTTVLPRTSRSSAGHGNGFYDCFRLGVSPGLASGDEQILRPAARVRRRMDTLVVRPLRDQPRQWSTGS